MDFITKQIVEMKKKLEDVIIESGNEGKTKLIRSSNLINLIHEAVKESLYRNNVYEENICPAIGNSKKELKIAGFLKLKNQDVCVIPKGIQKKERKIEWGPLAAEKTKDPNGIEFSEKSLVINVRSQLSSIAKNTDTLFERTFAEALNLHMTYPNIVLGEVFLIPVYEYDNDAMKEKKIVFKTRKTNIEKYISFFNAINDRKKDDDDLYKYERCTLIIVDFNRDIPKIYNTTEELKKDGVISKDFPIFFEGLNFNSFIPDLLKEYSNRFDIKLIVK